MKAKSLILACLPIGSSTDFSIYDDIKITVADGTLSTTVERGDIELPG